MIKAVCVKDCTWKGRYWKAGMEYEGHKSPPHHFKILVDLPTAEPEPQKTINKQNEQKTTE